MKNVQCLRKTVGTVQLKGATLSVFGTDSSRDCSYVNTVAASSGSARFLLKNDQNQQFGKRLQRSGHWILSTISIAKTFVKLFI